MIPPDRLIAAARAGDLRAVLDLLADGAPVDGRDADPAAIVPPEGGWGQWFDALGEDAPAIVLGGYPPLGRTPLMHACEAGHPDVVVALIDHGADISAVDVVGYSPLRICLTSRLRGPNQPAQDDGDDSDSALVLIGAGCDVQAPTVLDMDRTPLMLAVEREMEAVVASVIAAGAEVEARDQYGRTALNYAVRAPFPSPRIVRRLLAAGADPNSQPNVDEDDATPLGLALTFLKSQDSGPRTEVARLLLEYGARLPQPRNSPWPGRSAAMHAAATGDPSLFRMVRDRGADLHLRGPHGTALHAAAEGGSVEIVRELLAAGLDPREGCPFGMTPLHGAVAFGQADVARLLIDTGTPVDAPLVLQPDRPPSARWSHERIGVSPLALGCEWMAAASRSWGQVPLGRAEVIRFLLDAGADTQARGVRGRTPLSFAREAVANLRARLDGLVAYPDRKPRSAPGPDAVAQALADCERVVSMLRAAGAVGDLPSDWQPPELPAPDHEDIPF